MHDTVIYERNGSQASSGQCGAPTSDVTRGRNFLNRLLEKGVILFEEWQELPDETRERLLQEPSRERVTVLLVEAKLLTAYQASCLDSGGTEHLVLGDYRILDRIGAGGMGVVYRAEHKLLRRSVAIKVLQTPPGDNDTLLKRFFVETRALAQLRHRNIVWAFDAGVVPSPLDGSSSINYLVMEYVPGVNLERAVADATLGISQACEWMFQIASALDATHKFKLIHRDIKPSNILVTPGGQAKLLDFGLAMGGGAQRMTNPGTLLGTLSFMAPEQVNDAASVDIRADIFGLGATFYYCLTGKSPFPSQGSLTHLIAARLTQSLPEIRLHRPDVSPDLEAVVLRMMAYHRDERYATPQSVMRALLPHVNAASGFLSPRVHGESPSAIPEVINPGDRAEEAARVLIIDDEPMVRNLCKTIFRREGFDTHDACDGEEGLRLAEEQPFDLVLLDIDMPKMTGTEALRRLRLNPLCSHLKIIMISGGISSDDMSEVLDMGADDYLTKPLSRHQLVARARAALLHKATQDQSELLNQKLLRLNADLEKTLTARSSDLILARTALVYALARIVQSRTNETKDHLLRLQAYVCILGDEARRLPRLAKVVDSAFLQTLEQCCILHDIGNVALPDDVLRSATPLDAEERLIAQSHTTIGAETLGAVAKRDSTAVAFWQMAIDVARHHHERFDGAGYPDGLRGNDIPISARLLAIADAYDTLRAPRIASQGVSHQAAVEIMVNGSTGCFDPIFLQSFQQRESEFERIFNTYAEAT